MHAWSSLSTYTTGVLISGDTVAVCMYVAVEL